MRRRRKTLSNSKLRDVGARGLERFASATRSLKYRSVGYSRLGGALQTDDVAAIDYTLELVKRLFSKRVE